MAIYTELPAEIRQYVLRLALPGPTDWMHPWIDHVQNLMLVNKQTFKDMNEVFQTWSPVYRVKLPSSRHHLAIQARSKLCILPRPATLCLSLFHHAQFDKLRQASTFNRDTAALVPLLTDWNNLLPEILPIGINTVLVDATPAPSWLRKKGGAALASIVCDRAVRNYTLPEHQNQIIDLLKNIYNRTGPRVHIMIVGIYSVRSRGWVDEIVSACTSVHIPLSVDGEFVEKPPRVPKNHVLAEDAVRLSSQMRDLRSYNPDLHHLFHRIGHWRWRQSTQDVYASCLLKDADWPPYVLAELISFTTDPSLTTSDLRPSDAVQRKLAHRMTEDLGLWTETNGEEPYRFVRLSKSPKARPWEQSMPSDSNVRLSDEGRM